MRVYIDESGTHADEWLLIGMLFVPDHGKLHSALCSAKEDLRYFNASPKHRGRYKETHLAKFRSPRDVDLAKRWIDLFMQHKCYYRSVAVDWSIFDGSYFGDAFDPEALKRRRAYKKWAEMLLHWELKSNSQPIFNAKLYLDRLRVLHGYDIISEIRDRFTRNYQGQSPYIESFQHADSGKDANQCLQLCDLLTGCLYQQLVPSRSAEKLAARDFLATTLKPIGVLRLDIGFWKQYLQGNVSAHFPKFSVWAWRPQKD